MFWGTKMKISGEKFIGSIDQPKIVNTDQAKSEQVSKTEIFSNDQLKVENKPENKIGRKPELLSDLFASEDIVKSLEKASEGLLFMSESDYPFTGQLFKGQGSSGITEQKMIDLTDAPEDTKIETVDLDCFFENVANEQEWHSPEQKEEVAKYQNLIKLLKENLNDVKVYRIGEVEIKAFIIGTTKDGKDIAGLSTIQIET